MFAQFNGEDKFASSKGTYAMLCNMSNIGSMSMPIGLSGRIVIEIDPDLKRELYSALEDEGLSLKQWFLSNTELFLRDRTQLTLPFNGEFSDSGPKSAANE